MKILAHHLDLPLEPLTTLVVHEIETRRRTRLSIACIASILEIAVLMMTSDEQKETVCRIGKRIQLFAEDSEQLGNNIALFLTGNLKLDEEPKNGLRPLRHYICPITQDIEDWKNLELHEVQVPYKFDEIPEDGGHE